MVRYYDKNELKQSLDLGQIYELLELWGGEPQYNETGIIARTICHNPAGEGSRKLYYYSNSSLFHCFTSCLEPSFDIFELYIKVKKNQDNIDIELYDAMDYIASYFGLSGTVPAADKKELGDWEVFKKHSTLKKEPIVLPFLKEYDSAILDRFLYPHIDPWEKEGITYEICQRNLIGYYPGGEQITIPHFDIDGRLIGIRGRALAADEAERYGKYRPLIINKVLYSHALGFNLYNLNNSKENIKRSQTAIVFEGEKSALKMQSYFGIENDISVACCGSSLSAHHVELLKSLGVKEIIIAFDRQFVSIGDEEFKRLKAKLTQIYKKYGNLVKITAIFDKNLITPYKASPIDSGVEIFERLLKERIVPK